MTKSSRTVYLVLFLKIPCGRYSRSKFRARKIEPICLFKNHPSAEHNTRSRTAATTAGQFSFAAEPEQFHFVRKRTTTAL